ncbi:MAG: molybdate ABC transporter substrate-binding protein [Johnsonella sp.]|nr:molybdate ABC transporter substrate-binding protein [Johnsonella sp.]
MKKNYLIKVLAVAAVLSMTACGNQKAAETEQSKATAQEEQSTKKEETTQAQADTEGEKGKEEVKEMEKDAMRGTVNLAAAASLEKSFTDRLIPMFNEKYPDIQIVGSYDSSGKLQTQIEEGAEIDLFFSAAMKQMDALKEAGMMDEQSITQLLENKIVMIVPKGEESAYAKFEDLSSAQTIAIGDPESVPAGQYAKEALENLGIWEAVLAKASLGTNVTEVLNWVAEGSANAGIVYATDAAKMADKVSVIASAPEGSVKAVIYPVGILKASKNAEAAKLFLEFLKSEEALQVFKESGFSIYQP